MRTPPAFIVVTVLLTVAASSAPATVRADDEPEPPPKREVPDYDGRPPPPAPGEAALWIPRVLLSPLYFTSEFLLRRPLGFAVTKIEQERVPQKVMEFFSFGPENRGFWAPTFFYDFGLRPSVGLVFRYDDFIAADNEIKLGAATWGRDWVSGSIADEISPDDDVWSLELSGRAERRPDGVFMGIGKNTQDELDSRYQYTRYDAHLELALEDFWRTSELLAWWGITDMEFRAGTCCGEPSIAERVDRGQFDSPPPGFETGYLVYRQGAELAFDTRRPRPAPGHGVRLSGVAEQAFDLVSPLERRWLRFGGAATVFADVTGDQNVLSLSVAAHAIEPLSGVVPFTELVHLSGDGPLQGFVSRRLIGLSQVATRAEYSWPIWNLLDAAVHVAAGNVFDEDFSGFDLRALRLSYGVGIESATSRDSSFQLLLALGTDEINQGASIESFRFTLGGRREF